MMTNQTPLISLFIILAATLVMGCDINRHTGQEGRLVFEYYSAEDPHNFNKPIIEGGYLDVFITDIPRGRPVEILSATALTPEIASVEGFSENLFIIHGLSKGWANFEVHALDEDGQVRVDTIGLRVDRAHAIHFRPEGARVLEGVADLKRVSRSDDEQEKIRHLEVTTNSRVEIPWTRRSTKEEPLVGYGVYPVIMNPPDAAELHDGVTTHDTITLFMPDEPVIFELRPAKGLQGDILVIEVVSPNLTESFSIATAGLRSAALHSLSILSEPLPHPILSTYQQTQRTTLSQILAIRIGAHGPPIRDMLPWILTWLVLSILSLLMARSCWQNRPR